MSSGAALAVDAARKAPRPFAPAGGRVSRLRLRIRRLRADRLPAEQLHDRQLPASPSDHRAEAVFLAGLRGF